MATFALVINMQAIRKSGASSRLLGEAKKVLDKLGDATGDVPSYLMQEHKTHVESVEKHGASNHVMPSSVASVTRVKGTASQSRRSESDTQLARAVAAAGVAEPASKKRKVAKQAGL